LNLGAGPGALQEQIRPGMMGLLATASTRQWRRVNINNKNIVESLSV